MKLDDASKTRFAETGLLELRRAIPPSLTKAAKEALFAQLTRLRLREDGKWHTKKLDGVPPFQATIKIAQGLHHDAAFDEVFPQHLVALVSTLAGCELRAASPHPQPLVTPPQKGEWSLPTSGWHVDVAAPSSGVIPGVQIFVLIDDVAPKGGGTLALSGSHYSRDKTPVPERVVEMSGKAGDIYLMDMRVLHAPSLNASRSARLMLTMRYMNAAPKA